MFQTSNMQAAREQKLVTDHDLYLETKIIQDFITHVNLSDDSYQEEDHDTVNNHEDHDNYSEEENDEEGDDQSQYSKLRESDRVNYVSADDDEEEKEFSFTSEGANTSSTETDDGIINGQIMPVFPLFDRELFLSGEDLKPLQENFQMKLPVNKVFVETNQINDVRLVTSVTQGSDAITGPCCEWTGSVKPVKKSNSTGFSKFWRFKDLAGRSNSDGKDTFVFLNKSHAQPRTVVKRRDVELRPPAEPRKVTKSGKGKTLPLSAHAVYLKNKAKYEDRRRTYLPYRPELMGFFTNANVGFTKNVHPY